MAGVCEVRHGQNCKLVEFRMPKLEDLRSLGFRMAGIGSCRLLQGRSIKL